MTLPRREHLPARPGPRPTTATLSGQVQVDQAGTSALSDRLWAAMTGLESVVSGPSGIAGPSARAVHLSPAAAQGPAEAFIIGTEFGHQHTDGTGSLHLILPSVRAEQAVAAGWAEWHPTVIAGIRPPHLVLVYGPVDESAFDVVWSLVRDSHAFASGRAVP